MNVDEVIPSLHFSMTGSVKHEAVLVSKESFSLNADEAKAFIKNRALFKASHCIMLKGSLINDVHNGKNGVLLKSSEYYFIITGDEKPTSEIGWGAVNDQLKEIGKKHNAVIIDIEERPTDLRIIFKSEDAHRLETDLILAFPAVNITIENKIITAIINKHKEASARERPSTKHKSEAKKRSIIKFTSKDIMNFIRLTGREALDGHGNPTTEFKAFLELAKSDLKKFVFIAKSGTRRRGGRRRHYEETPPDMA